MPKQTIAPLQPPVFYAPNTSATAPVNNSNLTEGSKQNKTNFSSISKMPGDPRAESATVQNAALNMYNDKAVQKDLSTHADRQQGIVDDFSMDPEQWYKMYGYWNWDLAKNNPVGNLNNRSFGQTLSASRLADALNNRRHWRAAKIGRRTNSGFGTNEYTPGYSERWEPIETQEMRQMRANEQMDLAARQRQINRAESIQDYPLELQKQKDRINADLTKYASQSGIDLQRAMQAGKWKAEYAQSFDTYWSNFMTQFSKELDVDIRDRVMSKIANLKYPYSQIFAYLWGGRAVNPAVEAAYQYINALTDDILDPKVKAEVSAGAYASLAGIVEAPVVNTFRHGN